VVGWWLSRFFSKAGEASIKTKTISGNLVLPIKKINAYIKKKTRNGLSSLQMPLIENGKKQNLFFEQDFERQHVLIHGSTGTGKSVTISHLMNQIRGCQGHKMAGVDLNGAYISQYLKDGDVILNPADSRSLKWTIWTDCQEPEDFDNLAEILIPDNPKTDPIWINAPRQIFVEVAKKLKDDPKRSHELLLKIILSTPIEEYAQYFLGTDAQALTDERIEKTTLSIRAVLASYLKSLRYLDRMKGEEFSIVDWANNDSDKRWVFFSTQEKQLSSFRPLISCWLGILSKTCLSLEPDHEKLRHIWVVADEIASFRRIPTLSDSLAKARKFGVHYILSLQTYYQFEHAYGRHEAIVIMDNLNTQVHFRVKHPDTGEFVSKLFGEQEIEEVRENYSIGANSIRDGVSFGKVRTRRRVVSAEKIMGLADLECFIQQKGSIPIAKAKLQLPISINNGKSFVPRHTNIDSGDAQLEQLINSLRWHKNIIGDDAMAAMVVETSDDIEMEAKHKKSVDTSKKKQQKSREVLPVDEVIDSNSLVSKEVEAF
jgi:type IV conjugative transfer system coupling protein TraD